MGDVLLATPVVRMIRKRFPDARIDVAVKRQFAPLWEGNPHVGGIQTLDSSGIGSLIRFIRTIRAERYDAVVDLHGHWRTRMLTFFSGASVRLRYRADRWARFQLVHFHKNQYETIRPVSIKYLDALAPLGVPDDGGGLELVLDHQEIERADAILAGNGGDPRKWITLAPGARWPTKRWPAESYAELGRALELKGYGVLILGGKDDRSVCEAVASGLADPVTVYGEPLCVSAALLTRSRLVVANDTGLMHMACAVNTPVVALFGPTTRHFGFFPFRARAVVVEKPLPCRPCSYHGSERCPRKHFLCMRSIAPAEVIEKVQSLLETTL
jgi:heptosyltransferase-2